MTLAGKTVLVTRSAQQAGEFIALIRKNGGTAVPFPTIDISPPASWDPCDRALSGLHLYDGLIFTSTNGVDFFVNRMNELRMELEQLKKKMVFVVGEKTKSAVENYGGVVTLMPEKFTSLDLANALRQEDLKDKSFLFPCGDLANTSLADTVKLLGGTVDRVVVYRTQQPPPEEVGRMKMMILRGEIDIITFTSPSTVKNFARLVSAAELAKHEPKPIVAVIGPATESAAESLGLGVDVVAEQSTIESIVDSVIKYLNSSSGTSTLRKAR